MITEFRTDPYFLQRYSLRCAWSLILVGAAVAVGFSRHLSFDFWVFAPMTLLFGLSTFASILLAFVFALGVFFMSSGGLVLADLPRLTTWVAGGVYVGIWCNVLIHNAAHGNIRPRWLNRVVGEFAGLQLLSGFPGFAILHLEHHKHSDDPELDPHPNLPGQNFWQYVDGTRLRLRMTFQRLIRERWGDRPEVLTSWKRIKILLPLNRVLRAFLILALLGPEGFTFFFIPSHIAIQLAFAVINYYSHSRRADGHVEIINLDQTVIFRFLNRWFAGAFYHRNHHLRPGLFNPMKMPSVARKVLTLNADADQQKEGETERASFSSLEVGHV